MSAGRPELQLVKKGKVKEVYDAGNNTLLFYFTDDVSAFDKVIPGQIPHKGETLCRTGAYWFRKVEELGIKTHFIDAQGNTMTVRKVDRIEEPTTESVSYQIPVEAITRYYLTGSMFRRVQKGEVDSRALGFEAGYKPMDGEKLPRPVFEMTTKFEKVDRNLTLDESMELAGLTPDDVRRMESACFRIDDMMHKELASRIGFFKTGVMGHTRIDHELTDKQEGLIHVDGKKEFAFDEDRNLVLIDTFGTADEDRFWEKRPYIESLRMVEQGKSDRLVLVQKSKEFIRKYYEDINYLPQLLERREENKQRKKEGLEPLPEPPIPALPDDMVSEASKLYIEVFEKLTGQEFRTE